MKKTLLSIGAALLFGFSAIAGTVTPTTLTCTNEYQKAGSAQAKGALTGWSITLAAEEIYKVTISATNASAYDLTAIEFAFVDDSEAAKYWAELSAFATPAQTVAAGASFEVSGFLTVKDAATIAGLPASLSGAKLAVNCKSSNAAFTDQTDNAKSTVTVDFTNVTITIAKQTIPNGTVLNDNGSGVNQLNVKGKLPEAFQEGTQLSVTITGTASADVSLFQVVAVDENAPAYWTEMSEYTDLTGTITAGTAFSVTGVLEITKNIPAAINADARTLALMATSGQEMLGIENLEITVAPYTGPALCEDETANNVGEPLPCTYDPQTAISTVEAATVAVKASSIEVSSDKTIASVVVTNVIGAQVVNQAIGAASASVSTANLQAGIYYATINFANGSVQVVKFAK